MGSGLARRGLRRAALVALAAAFAVYVLVVATGHGASALGNVLYSALLFSGALVCLARVVALDSDRLAWGLMGIGLAAWASADLGWTFVIGKLDEPPYPSLADAGWLAWYPCSYAAVLLLLRSRRRSLPTGLWLDGAIAALGAAALVAAVVLDPVLAAAVDGAAAAVATNLAYPVGDLLLLVAAICAFGATGWRPDRLWLLLGGGLIASGAADTIYLVSVAHGTYVEGGPMEILWPLSALLVGWAAWQPARRGAPHAADLRTHLVPAGFAVVAIVLVVWDHFERLPHFAVLLAAVSLLLVVVRMSMAFSANVRMLRASRRDALTDALTGLGNRRRLMDDLDAAVEDEDGDVLLVLFDLDGFKRYNDSFGHPAGDALLRRLGSQLGAAVASGGRAYRVGGDEFCVLVGGAEPGRSALVEAAAGALRESGEGFAIAASYGSVPIGDVGTAAEALQVADQRMYGHKLERSARRGRDARDVLMRILHEREPELHEHITSVAALARAVGRRLELAPEAIDVLARAAELHDIGKMAIPDTILSKPGPLDDDEWAFMRRHTLIGEAILSASPALVPVARIVRASHERVDGTGYPDALAGEEIPVAARIVAICDAYDAMISDRSYRRGMPPEAALAELRRGAGTQFDAAIVETFCAVLAEQVSDAQRLAA
jgi:diguanylate cyclase (GGDEF)-like protein